MCSIERVLVRNYEQARLELSVSVRENRPEDQIRAACVRCTEAMKRLRLFLLSGEVPEELQADRINTREVFALPRTRC